MSFLSGPSKQSKERPFPEKGFWGSWKYFLGSLKSLSRENKESSNSSEGVGHSVLLKYFIQASAAYHSVNKDLNREASVH